MELSNSVLFSAGFILGIIGGAFSVLVLQLLDLLIDYISFKIKSIKNNGKESD